MAMERGLRERLARARKKGRVDLNTGPFVNDVKRAERYFVALGELEGALVAVIPRIVDSCARPGKGEGRRCLVLF